MKKYTIGIDCDSTAHGLAIYQDGKLITCGCATTITIINDHILTIIRADSSNEIIFSIENVMTNQFVYRRNEKSSKAAQSKVGMHIGRCQQAQVELTRWLDYYQIPYVLHAPQKGNWANNKELFEKITGWTGRSNADSRSAAYFGYLAL